MPTSHPSQIPALLSIIMATYGKSFLDIGPGVGKWGLMVREYMDISDGRENYAREGWRCRIDCIEAFPDYVTPVHEYIYNNVYKGNARDIVPELSTKYDLTLMIDVLEHFSYEDGIALLRSLLTKSRGILISVPKDNGEQGAAFGNEWERHRFLWRRQHLAPLGPHFSVRNDRSTIIYIGSDAKKVRARFLLSKLPRGVRRIVMQAAERKAGA